MRLKTRTCVQMCGLRGTKLFSQERYPIPDTRSGGMFLLLKMTWFFWWEFGTSHNLWRERSGVFLAVQFCSSESCWQWTESLTIATDGPSVGVLHGHWQEQTCTYIATHAMYTIIRIFIWRFPEIRVPLIIHFNRMFPYKPSIFGYPHFRKPPYVAVLSKGRLIKKCDEFSRF